MSSDECQPVSALNHSRPLVTPPPGTAKTNGHAQERGSCNGGKRILAPPDDFEIEVECETTGEEQNARQNTGKQVEPCRVTGDAINTSLSGAGVRKVGRRRIRRLASP